APLCRAELFARAPRAAEALLSLRGRLSLDEMRRLNGEVQAGDSPAHVAAEWLSGQGLGGHGPERAQVAPSPQAQGSLSYALHHLRELSRLTARHLELTLTALLFASLVGLGLGIVAARARGLSRLILGGTGTLQTIPGLALLAFLVPWLGIGVWPALCALFLYALLPIVQATHAGMTGIDPVLVDAARGLGMTDRQIALRLRLPLSAGIVLSGLRTSAVTAVGTATLAAFVGAGGLGEPILAGLTLGDSRLILFGAVPAALLALAVDAALAGLERVVGPRR
ncbi:MAG: ABC transporter permease, partial [Deltaproteobacteria bacterium]